MLVVTNTRDATSAPPPDSAVNESVLKAVMIVKQITGQIIFFLVPLIILGFVAPSIARLKSNASKVLLFAFSIAYLSSVGAATFGAVVGYELIPHLHIQTASEGLKDIPPMLFNLEIPPVMSVMSALVLAVMLGLSTAWVKSEEMERLLEVFQNMVLKLVERVLPWQARTGPAAFHRRKFLCP